MGTWQHIATPIAKQPWDRTQDSTHQPPAKDYKYPTMLDTTHTAIELRLHNQGPTYFIIRKTNPNHSTGRNGHTHPSILAEYHTPRRDVTMRQDATDDTATTRHMIQLNHKRLQHTQLNNPRRISYAATGRDDATGRDRRYGTRRCDRI